MALWNIFSNNKSESNKYEPILVGDDLGYGQIKVFAGPNGQEAFASAVGTPVSTLGRTSAVVTRQELLNRLAITYKDQIYYVGKNAIVNTRNARLTLRQDKTATDHNLVKFLTSLALLTDEDQEFATFDIVTGLPVLEYKNESDNLRNTLLNNNKTFVFDFHYGPKTVTKTIKVRQVEVISQGEGAFYDFILNSKGEIIESREKLVSGKVIIVDIGYRTTDIVTMEAGSYIETLSYQYNNGVNQIHQEVLRLIMERLQIKKELREMDEIVRTGKLFHNTKHIDVNKILDDVAIPFAEDIADNLHTISNDQLGSVNHIIFTGGGSEIIYPFVSAKLKGVVETSIMDKAEFCNASGYYKYGLLLKTAGQME